MLAGMRLRGWRRNAHGVPGKPDAAFSDKKVAIFVDGCFWHGCPHCSRPFPENNPEYWVKKINRNVDRDKEVDQQLVESGWKIVRIWEHEMKLKADRQSAQKRIVKALE